MADITKFVKAAIVILVLSAAVIYLLRIRGHVKEERLLLRPVESKDAKIAIILDDFGYNTNNLNALFEIDSPLTVSILPNLACSERIAKEAAKRNFEIILHLPLEPHDEGVNLEEGTIMVNMTPDAVDNLLAKAINSVPGVKGVSNHMGSKATESRVLMRELFEGFRRRNLYFIDNLVTEKSVCEEIAAEVGLRTTARSVFLDNESDEDYIKGQILLTAALAAKTGWAIGVGHDKSCTIKVLTEVIPQLEKTGFEFVYVSALVK